MSKVPRCHRGTFARLDIYGAVMLSYQSFNFYPMEIMFFWFLFTFLVGYLAAQRGRSVLGWVLLSFFTSPLVAGLLVLIVGKKRT